VAEYFYFVAVISVSKLLRENSANKLFKNLFGNKSFLVVNTTSIGEPQFTQDRDRRTRTNTPSGSASHNEASLKNTTPNIAGIMSQRSGQIRTIGKVSRLENARN
jgi:hypothetical protein